MIKKDSNKRNPDLCYHEHHLCKETLPNFVYRDRTAKSVACSCKSTHGTCGENGFVYLLKRLTKLTSVMGFCSQYKINQVHILLLL